MSIPPEAAVLVHGSCDPGPTLAPVIRCQVVLRLVPNNVNTSGYMPRQIYLPQFCNFLVVGDPMNDEQTDRGHKRILWVI